MQAAIPRAADHAICTQAVALWKLNIPNPVRSTCFVQIATPKSGLSAECNRRVFDW